MNPILFGLLMAVELAILMAALTPFLTLFVTGNVREAFRSIFTVAPVFALSIGGIAVVPTIIGSVLAWLTMGSI